MADMLGKPQKITTIEALRRILNEKRENNIFTEERNKNRFSRSNTQIEGTTDYNSPPSILIPSSRCSSPSCNSNKSSVSPHSSRSLRQGISSQIIPDKSPSRKYLSINRSPHSKTDYSSPRVVRKRCAVCYEKYQNEAKILI